MDVNRLPDPVVQPGQPGPAVEAPAQPPPAGPPPAGPTPGNATVGPSSPWLTADWRRWPLRRWLGVAASGLLAALFGLTIVLPISRALLFRTGCTIDEARCTLARQWSDTISKLGIEPVFPPEEDLHVGDVFVVLTSIAGHENQDPILSKSVKIAHLDLTAAMQEVYRQLPIFPDTPAPPSLAEAALADGADIFQGAWPRNRLPLVAFPALTIEHTQSLEGSWGWLGRALSGGHSADDVETIELVDTSSYGVPALYATQALENFCRFAPEVCSEDGARRLVSYVVGAKYAFGARADGRLVNEVSLYIVDRVYLARTIRQHRGNETTDSANGTAPPAQRAGAKVSGQSSFGLNQSFTRPVAIGFRAVHVLPALAGRKLDEHADAPGPLPALLRRAINSAGLITAPGTQVPQALPPVQNPSTAAPPAAEAPSGPSPPAASTTGDSGCLRSGIAKILCGSLRPSLQAPMFGNTQAISPDSRRFFENQHVDPSLHPAPPPAAK